MLENIIVPLLLIGLSGLLLDSHRRSWRAARQNEKLSDRDRRFARSQYFRRTQASGIIGLIGAGLGVRPLVPDEPLPFLIYLAALVGGCACMMLLALLDVWATRQNFRRIRNEQLAGEVTLAMERRSAGKKTGE